MGWNSGRVLGSYWDVETSGQSTSAGGEGKSGIEMRRRVTYVGWDFDVVWGIVEGLRTPYFRWQSSVGGELRLLEVDGSEWRGILGAGVYDYYKVVYGGGRVYVMLELEPEVGGRWELIWSKFGRCDMYRNDGVVESLGGVVRRLIVINPGEVYYVSVLYLGGVGVSGGYKIRAYSVVGREVSSFEPRFGSNVGEVSIRLSGLGMSEAKFLRLLDSGGRVLREVLVEVFDEYMGVSKIDLVGLEAQECILEVEWVDGSRVRLGDVFEVLEGRGGELRYRLEVPSAVRVGRVYRMNLWYGNVGYSDVRAPVFVVVSGENNRMRVSGTGGRWWRGVMLVYGGNVRPPYDVLPPGFENRIGIEFYVESEFC